MKPNKFLKFVNKKRPEILIFFGISGFLSSTVLAVKATPKAMKAIEEKKEELDKEKLTVGETVKTTWKYYIPAIGSAVGGVVCILGANGIHNRRNAALASAFSITDTAYKKYVEKTKEVIGEDKEKQIQDEIAKEEIKKNPYNPNTVIGTPEIGRTLCFDMGSGRYFYKNIEDVKRVENEISARLREEMFIYLNEFYDELEIEEISTGDMVGFDIEKQNPIDIRYSHIEINVFNNELMTMERVPVCVIDYRVFPIPEWKKF